MSAIPFVGILNQGSTCYLNSVIQALYHIPLFRQCIYSIDVSKEPEGAAAELQLVFAQLESGCSGITTTRLTKAFGWEASESLEQRDVHELTQQLFDSLESCVKGTPQANFVRDIFGGIMAYRTRAQDVKYVSDRVEGFYDVEVVVAKQENIEQSLKQLGIPETIEGVSLEVDGPGKPASAHTVERSQSFVQLPPVLLIHPNRVSFDMETYQPVIINNEWRFETTLDFTPFYTDPSTLKMDKESMEKFKTLDQAARKVTSLTYTLRSVLIHAGSAQVGHYYSFVCYGSKWYRFNDEIVDEVTVDDVRHAAFGGHPENRYRPFSSERASLLVYVNDSRQDDVLRAINGPKDMLARAKEVAAETARLANSVPYSYFFCDSNLASFLDRVPRTKESALTVLMPQDCTSADVEEELCKIHGVPRGELRVLTAQSVERHMSRFTAQAVGYSEGVVLVQRLKPGRKPFIGFLRQVSKDSHQASVLNVFDSREELLVQLRSGVIFALDAVRPDARLLTSDEDIQDGVNLLKCPEDYTKDDVLRFMYNKRWPITQVIFCDPVRRIERVQLGSFPIAPSTRYTDLQAFVFDLLSRSAAVRAKPETANHVAFCRCLDGYPMDLLSKISSTGVERGLAQMVPHGLNSVLYCTSVPYDVDSINFGAVVFLNLGWGAQPQICLQAEQCRPSITFASIVKETFKQLKPLAKEFPFINHLATPNAGGSWGVRLIATKNSQVVDEYVDLDAHVKMGSALFVLDPINVLPDHDIVDVHFCNRRVGELYFGFPTSVPVSKTLSEPAEVIIQRVAKKLNVPKPEQMTAKWTLSLRCKNTAKFCTATSKGDTLKKLVDGIGDKDFIIIIDRPKEFELDMDETEWKSDTPIVIKTSASSTGLSNMAA